MIISDINDTTTFTGEIKVEKDTFFTEKTTLDYLMTLGGYLIVKTFIMEKSLARYSLVLCLIKQNYIKHYQVWIVEVGMEDNGIN